MTPKRLKLISQFSGLAMLLFGAVAAMGWLSKLEVFSGVMATQIAAGLSVLCGVVSRWAAGQLPPEKSTAPPAGPAVLLVALLGVTWALVFPACGHYTTAWKGTATAMEITNTTATGLDVVGRPAYEQCKQHGLKTPEYASCAGPWILHLTNWQGFARPAMRAAVAATYGGLRMAEAAGKKGFDWMAALKPGACALLRGFKEWGHKLPDKGKAALAGLGFLDPLLCTAPKVKSGAGFPVVAIAALALEVVKWVVDILGQPNEKIRKRIDAWLLAPPADATDQLLLDFKAGLP